MFYTRRIKLLLIIGLGSLLSLTLFYSGFELASYRIVNQYALAAKTRNSVKHAYAAATFYSVLRWIGIDKNSAERQVLFLGKLNEYAERYIKLGEKDSDGEIRKDFNNNWAGIVAAEWCLNQHPPKDIAQVISLLASHHLLMIVPVQMPNMQQNALQKVNNAWYWLHNNRQRIETDILSALNQSFSDSGKLINVN